MHQIGEQAIMHIGLIFHMIQMQQIYGKKAIYMLMTKQQKERCENNA